MYCPHCGKNNEEGSAFCEHCGKSLIVDQADEFTSDLEWDDEAELQAAGTKQDDRGKGGGKKVALIAVAAVAVIAIIIAAVVLTRGGSNKDAASDAASDAATSIAEQAVSEVLASSQETTSAAAATEHRIVFETFGGSTYEVKTAKDGALITTPQDPTKPGSKFEGWYFDQGLTSQVSFPYTVKETDPETLIFYAKWSGGNGVSQNATDAHSQGDAGYYENCIFPYSSSEYLTAGDVAGLTDWQVQRAINEIYARNGYIFQSSASEKAFFESQSWYRGSETNQEVVQGRFNEYEKANIKLLTTAR